MPADTPLKAILITCLEIVTIANEGWRFSWVNMRWAEADEASGHDEIACRLVSYTLTKPWFRSSWIALASGGGNGVRAPDGMLLIRKSIWPVCRVARTHEK